MWVSEVCQRHCLLASSVMWDRVAATNSLTGHSRKRWQQRKLKIDQKVKKVKFLPRLVDYGNL